MRREQAETWVQGLTTGFIGYVSIALMYGGMNLLQGRSAFYTASKLGEVLLYGKTGSELPTLAIEPILAFNGVHLVAFLLIGCVASWLLYEAELHPHFWFFAFFAFLAGFIFSVATAQIVTTPVRGVVPLWSVFVANALAAFAMAAFLSRYHRGLIRRAEQVDGIESNEMMEQAVVIF
jgi:hypothetical protein